MTRWTNHELARLKQFYPVWSTEKLALAFPTHPINSVLVTARKLKLRKRKGWRDWKAIAAAHTAVIFEGRQT